MMWLRKDESRDIERKLHDPTWRTRLQRVQDIVKREFENFQNHAETLVIRTIIPRIPIKEISRVLYKIREQRGRGLTQYSLGDLEDLVGIKILCPYPSDVMDVIGWLRTYPKFRVSPESVDAARREKKEGYRGYHFSVQLSDTLLVNNEDLMGVRCEVQVKTMLEEAWDAKTHDLTYRREEHVHPRLLKEMKKISDELARLDGETEILQNLILERETLERQRKEAVVAVYLHESIPEAIEVISQIPNGEELIQGNFTSTNVLSIIPLIQKYREERNLSKHWCRLAALVGLFAKGRHLDVWVLDVCEEMIRQNPDDPRSYLTKGSICWALDRLDDAIEFAEEAIKKAESRGDEDLVVEGKGSCAYWIAEKVWNEAEMEPALVALANIYIDDALRIRPGDPSNLDTKGFLLITTGLTEELVETGRQLIREAQSSAGPEHERIATAFFRRHETIALIRLAKLSEK